MCLTRLPEGVNSTIPRNALRKNTSGVAMRMKIRQSKTPQLHKTNSMIGHCVFYRKHTLGHNARERGGGEISFGNDTKGCN